MSYLVSQITLLVLVASQLFLLDFALSEQTVVVTFGTEYGLRNNETDSTNVCKEKCTESCVQCNHPKECDTEDRRFNATRNATYAKQATERFCSEEPAKKKFDVTCPAVERCEPIENKCKFAIEIVV